MLNFNSKVAVLVMVFILSILMVMNMYSSSKSQTSNTNKYHTKLNKADIKLSIDYKRRTRKIVLIIFMIIMLSLFVLNHEQIIHLY